jgi:hypothetical protein
MVLIILGFVLVAAGLYFAVGNKAIEGATGSALKGISVQGPAWLLLVAFGVGTILFGAWLEHESTSTTQKDKTENTVPEPTVPFFEQPDVYTFGDDNELDRLWRACERGDWLSCDDLYFESPVDSEYEWFGASCGGIVPNPTGEYCAVENREGES